MGDPDSLAVNVNTSNLAAHFEPLHLWRNMEGLAFAMDACCHKQD
jgi:hypothetical protein